jgi:uroporphyrinogen-III synthase
MAVEARTDRPEVLEVLAVLDHRPTRLETDAERSLLARLGGGCNVPLAASAAVQGDRIELRARLVSPDGTIEIVAKRTGEATREGADRLGKQLARDLQDRGASKILEAAGIGQDPADWGPLDEAISQLPDGFDGLILTSANAVHRWAGRARLAGLDPIQLRPRWVVVAGDVTRAALAEYGVIADLVPTRSVSEEILRLMTEQVSEDLPGSTWLMPRAKVAREVLPDGLRSVGARVIVAPAYETRPPADSGPVLKKLEAGLAGITFASGSAVRNLQTVVGDKLVEKLAGVAVASIGPVTTKACTDAGLHVAIESETASIPMLAQAIVQHLREAS